MTETPAATSRHITQSERDEFAHTTQIKAIGPAGVYVGVLLEDLPEIRRGYVDSAPDLIILNAPRQWHADTARLDVGNGHQRYQRLMLLELAKADFIRRWADKPLSEWPVWTDQTGLPEHCPNCGEGF